MRDWRIALRDYVTDYYADYAGDFAPAFQSQLKVS